MKLTLKGILLLHSLIKLHSLISPHIAIMFHDSIRSVLILRVGSEFLDSLGRVGKNLLIAWWRDSGCAWDHLGAISVLGISWRHGWFLRESEDFVLGSSWTKKLHSRARTTWDAIRPSVKIQDDDATWSQYKFLSENLFPNDMYLSDINQCGWVRVRCMCRIF